MSIFIDTKNEKELLLIELLIINPSSYFFNEAFLINIRNSSLRKSNQIQFTLC